MAAIVEFSTLKYCLLFALLLSLCLKGGASRSLSMVQVDEDLEIERQLNKPPIKTIHTKWGGILDCVDINKQPAFDHPLLKDHKIQLKPTFSLKGDEKLSSTDQHESCPKGTVPIRRTSREDLIGAKYVTKFAGERLGGLSYNMSGETYFGAAAEINIYKPALTSDDQFSAAEMSVENGPDGIRVGWMVNPKEFHNNNTHLFILWTNDGYKTVCYNNNLQCPGFVQVDSTVGPGSEIPNTSVYGGDQYVIPFKLYQENTTGHWWLVVTVDNQERKVGYWPKELFTSLSGGCSHIYWGGHVKTSASGISPEMGSGHYPTPAQDYQRECFYRNLHYLARISDDKFLNPKENQISKVVECDRYRVFYSGYQDVDFGHTFRFGGPGGQCK